MYQSDQCDVFGIEPVTGLSARATGINIGPNTRPAHLSWDGQAGVLLHTVSTTNTTYT